jgi:hypothetical protein
MDNLVFGKGGNQHTLNSGKQIPTTTYKLNIIYITKISNTNHYIHVTIMTAHFPDLGQVLQ